jgi:hypothetical protein
MEFDVLSVAKSVIRAELPDGPEPAGYRHVRSRRECLRGTATVSFGDETETFPG